MFETGVNDFHVVLGDSNLKIDLPFGVQQHEISQVIVHENYRPDDSFHYQDIGLIKLQTFAKMETTVCMLCLPETFKDYSNDNCTVVGYGRPSTAALNQFARGKFKLFNQNYNTMCNNYITILMLFFTNSVQNNAKVTIKKNIFKFFFG